MALLADLIATVTETDLFNIAMAALRVAGVPVDSWLDSVDVGIGTTHVTMEQEAETRNATAALAASGYLDYATGVGLTLYAKSQFDITRYPAVFTEGWWLLSSVASAPQHDRTAGDLTGGTAGRSGLLYASTTGGTLRPGGYLLVKMTAQEAGPAYNLAVSTTVALRTTLVGVTVENMRGVIEIPGVDDDGGVVYVKLAGSTPSVTHVVSGISTALSVFLDNEEVIVTVATDGSGTAISTAAEVAAAVNADSESSSYVYAQATGAGTSVVGEQDETGFSTWITTQGADEEPDGTSSPPTGVKGRCALRWSTLGCGGSEEALLYWALALPSGYDTSPVSRAMVFPGRLGGTIVGGGATVLVAGPAGALTATDLAAVTANFESPKKYSVGTRVEVDTTINLTYSITGIVYVLRAANYSIAEVQALVAATLALYQTDLNVGGQGLKVYAQKVGARIEGAVPSAIRNAVLTNSAETAVAYNQSVIFDVSGLSYALVDA